MKKLFLLISISSLLLSCKKEKYDSWPAYLDGVWIDKGYLYLISNLVWNEDSTQILSADRDSVVSNIEMRFYSDGNFCQDNHNGWLYSTCGDWFVREDNDSIIYFNPYGTYPSSVNQNTPLADIPFIGTWEILEKTDDRLKVLQYYWSFRNGDTLGYYYLVRDFRRK